MKLSEAMDGFFLSLRAGGYSGNTIALYRHVLGMLTDYLNDPEVKSITLTDLQTYFVYLQDEYQARRKSGDTRPLSGSSLQNHWKGIRAFFNWATPELRLKRRPDERLRLPDRNPKVVHPLNKEEVKALIVAAEFTREAQPGNRSAFKMRRRTADRDLALLYVMLDTGLRAGEVGRLKISDYDSKTGELNVAPYGVSNRKTKSRLVFIGKVGQRAVWRYLASRKGAEPTEPLFMSERGRPMDRNSIRCLLADLGTKAGVKNVHPHRLRHTFSVEFLRNSGDVFSLKRLLGHSSLTMVQVYLELSSADTRSAHRKASPADNWGL